MDEKSKTDWTGPRSLRGWATGWARQNEALRRGLSVLSVVILGGALLVLYRQIRNYEFAQVWTYLRGLPVQNIVFAVLLTGLNFGVLTGYDALALRYVKTPLSRERLWFSAVVGYSVSQAVGSPLLTGGSVRYRLYSGWGMAPDSIGKAILFAGVSFWLGFLALGGALILFQPVVGTPALDLTASAALLGVGCLLPPLLYVGAVLFGRPLRFWSWELETPPLWMLPVQLGLAAGELVLAAGVLYVLLPPSATVGFLEVVAVYLIALLLGILSHVPGGLGVFDGMVLALLTPALPPPDVLGALLAYRGIFHLLPLTLAGAAFAAYELWRR